MCMVVYVFIYIKCLEGVKAMVECEVVRNLGGTCNTHEMCTAHHAVEMDDWHSQITHIIIIGLNLPHSSLSAWCGTNGQIPGDQCTRKVGFIMMNRKEMAYSCHIQPTETWFIGIMLNKNTIVPRRTTSPGVNGSNTFMKHPPCAGQVAWGIVKGNGGGKNMDLGHIGKNRTIWQRNIVELNVCIKLYQLFMEKSANEVWEVRNIEVDTKAFNCERKISNCTIAQWSEITERWQISWRLTGGLHKNHLTINIAINHTSIIILLTLKIIGWWIFQVCWIHQQGGLISLPHWHCYWWLSQLVLLDLMWELMMSSPVESGSMWRGKGARKWSIGCDSLPLDGDVQT